MAARNRRGRTVRSVVREHKLFAALFCASLYVLIPARASYAQANGDRSDQTLFLVDEQTTVSGISFEFDGGETFDTGVLVKQLATERPTTWHRLQFWKSGSYPFDPVMLAKDVVRLRRFYNRNGFLFPTIDYRASVLDTSNNSIKIIFRINEGNPVIIQDFGYFNTAGDYLQYSFDEDRRRKWEKFRDKTSLELGARFTFFQEAAIQGQLLSWLNEQSYAHAVVRTESVIDSTNFTADVRFVVDTGPEGKFSEILIEGAEKVESDVVRRELPFRIGDEYARSKVIEGQRELFGLKLFRVVTADLPEQPRDSSVVVRYRVRESKLRFVSPQGGYSLPEGITTGLEWRHRNFRGGGRNLSFNLTARTGVFASPGGDNVPPRFFQASVALLQPAMFSRRITATVTPFVQVERDTQLEPSESTLGLNRREYGITTSAVYEILPFRTVSLSHRFGFVLHTRPIDLASQLTRDPFNRSIVSATGLLGRTDNFFNPRSGFRITPSLEVGAAAIGSEIEYYKFGTEVVAYIPLSDEANIVGRISATQVRPIGDSKIALEGGLSTTDSLLFENRFEDVFLYAGGADNVRGWPDDLLGPKTIRQTSTNAGSQPQYSYEAAGGRVRAIASISLRVPFPGLGPKWKLATFVDAGALSSIASRSTAGSLISADDGVLRLKNTKFGAGSGVRYETAFGFVRLDLAYKINPSREDLQTPEQAFLGSTDESFSKRFRLHLTIGQAF